MWARNASPSGSANAALRRRPYLASATCQPASSKNRFQPDRSDVGDDAVEALAVEVDDHREVSETLRRRIGDRFPDIAFVEFGVPHEREESGRRETADVGVDVAPGECREQWCHGAEADRAGREVGDVGVLGARRVGLQPAALSQRGQVRTVEFAGQVLDGVIDGRSVGFDGHLVLAAQVPEPERRHDRRDRRTRCLVPPDLHVRSGGRGSPVGVIDDACRKPQDATFDGAQHLEVGMDVVGIGVSHRRQSITVRGVMSSMRFGGGRVRVATSRTARVGHGSNVLAGLGSRLRIGRVDGGTDQMASTRVGICVAVLLCGLAGPSAAVAVPASIAAPTSIAAPASVGGSVLSATLAHAVRVASTSTGAPADVGESSSRG
jgi:hypothetical protein